MRILLGTDVSVFRMSFSRTACSGMSASRFGSTSTGIEEILAVDLQAMARIEHQRNGIGALRRHLGRELADLLAHLVLRQIGRAGHVESGIGEQLRHRLRVVGRIGQRRHGAVSRLADDERDTVFGKRRLRTQ